MIGKVRPWSSLLASEALEEVDAGGGSSGSGKSFDLGFRFSRGRVPVGAVELGRSALSQILNEVRSLASETVIYFLLSSLS